jgi:D-aspartate ligase
VRDLGARGVPITLGSDSRLAPARWSRYVTTAERCPSTCDHDRFLRWLREVGGRRPGHVLYPTSDDAAWLMAAHRAELGAAYLLYSPPPAALARLLDKGRLTRAAGEAGLCTPETWWPEDEGDVERLSREAELPLFVKPRTRLLSAVRFKGGRVDRPEDLLRLWRRGCLPAAVERRLGPAMEGSGRPLVLKYYAGAESIFTVDGFIDRGGRMVTRGCHKLLQHPRRLGAGILFEEAPVPSEVASGLARLLRGAGFFGVFDAEFVRDGGRVLLIDVNPRFYNHMAFEIERGLPLPWLAYLGAHGDDFGLGAALTAAARAPAAAPDAFVHRLPARLMLAGQRLAGHMSRSEGRGWRRWMKAHRAHATDPARAPGDAGPVRAEIAYLLAAFLRHPRAFARDLWRDGAVSRQR